MYCGKKTPGSIPQGDIGGNGLPVRGTFRTGAGDQLFVAHHVGKLPVRRAQDDVKPGGHIGVHQPVEDVLPLFFVHDETGIPQQAQLLGHIRLWFFQQRFQMANTFGVTPQRVENAQPFGVRQQFDAIAQSGIVGRHGSFRRKMRLDICSKMHIQRYAYFTRHGPVVQICTKTASSQT